MVLSQIKIECLGKGSGEIGDHVGDHVGSNRELAWAEDA